MTAAGTEPALEVTGLSGGYGDSQVLFDVALTVQPGSVTALLGRNGVGKTTFVRCVTGLLPMRSGTVRLSGKDVTGRPAHETALQGLGVVSQGKRVFPSLTVGENLDLALLTRQRRARAGADVGLAWSTERILELFPVFRDRMRTRAGSLSGGEQQSLSLARAMAGGPAVLLLDEPSEALSPARVSELSGLLQQLRDGGMPILLVEQNVRFAGALADSVAVMDKGRIMMRCSRAELPAQRDRLDALLTI